MSAELAPGLRTVASPAMGATARLTTDAYVSPSRHATLAAGMSRPGSVCATARWRCPGRLAVEGPTVGTIAPRSDAVAIVERTGATAWLVEADGSTTAVGEPGIHLDGPWLDDFVEFTASSCSCPSRPTWRAVPSVWARRRSSCS